MKLFGGNGAGSHMTRRETSAAPAAAKEKKQSSFSGFFSGGWKKYRTPLIILGCVIVLLLAAVVVYAIWEKPPETNDEGLKQVETQPPVATLRPIITPPPTEKPVETESPVETETPGTEVVPQRKADCYTFALLVMDQVGANTDTILVGRMDTANDTLDLVNIPRDTLVNVSWQVKKINTVLVSERNDAQRFIDHLSGLIGFAVDNYAIMNVKAVESLVDCIGGVSFYVPRDMDYDDPTQDLHIHIPAGIQFLNGEDAVKVLRYRVGNNGTGYATGDIGRIATQQALLKELATQLLKLGNIPNLDKLIEIVQKNVETDLTANNIAFFAREFLTMNKDNIRFQTAPGEGITIRGGAYYGLNTEDWLEIINSSLNPYNTEVTKQNLDILSKYGEEGAVSTTGEFVPLQTFLDFWSLNE